jgi:hypothetical protein
MAFVKTKRQVPGQVSRGKSGAKARTKAVSGSLGPEGANLKGKLSSGGILKGKKTPVETAYIKALKLSRQTRKPVRFMVDIHPDGAQTVTPFDERSATIVGDRPVARSSELDRALDEARHRGRRRVSEILARPEMLSADAFAESLGTTRATITAWRHKNKVLGLEGATRGFRFPEWQVADEGKPFAVLPELFDRLGGDAWAVYRFLVQRHPELGGMTAKDALRKGRFGEVVAAAESVARAFA